MQAARASRGSAQNSDQWHDDYTITFKNVEAFAFSEKDVADNSLGLIDSDVNVATGATDVLTLGEGQHIGAIDAGIFQEGFVNPFNPDDDPALSIDASPYKNIDFDIVL